MSQIYIRRIATMAAYRTSQCSPFTQAVVNCMRQLYPESLADKSFDNTGLLLEAPWNPANRLNNSVLLTIDLTRAVADEAIKRRDSVIVAYHPIIFRGIKSLTLNDPQQDSLLRLAREGISVYSPHTAVDAVPGGMADWLCDIVTGNIGSQSIPLQRGLEAQEQPPPLPPRHSQPEQISESPVLPHTRTVLYPNPSPPAEFENAGMGRLVTFLTPQPLSTIINRIAQASGTPNSFSVAVPQGRTIEDVAVRTVATCPGSGSSILIKGGMPAADLLLTGELSHHDALTAIERGSAVITLFHSNSERGYLKNVMQQRLSEALKIEWTKIREEMAESLDAGSREMEYILENGDAVVEVSERDRDPYVIINASTA
ncbi:hypothetical protein VTO42DRAFT_7532 [Malbranchea cinnamomea]